MQEAQCAAKSSKANAPKQASAIKVIENGPGRLVIEVSGQFLDASTRQQQIILYADVPKIDLVTKLDWAGKPNVQVYQEFPLNVDEPAVRYAIPYGWEQFGEEMKYSAPWFSHDTRPVSEHRRRGVRGWGELSNRGHSVALASQCNYAAFKDLSEHPEAGFLIQPLLLRTVRTCGGNHFFYEQKGQHEFRFALQADGDSTHLGEELDSPLLPYFADLAAQASGRSPGLPDRLSFLSSKNENVHVAVVKKAEDGRGLIVRLVEMKERTRPTQAKLLLFRPVQTAGHTSMIEEDQDKIVPSGTTISVQCAPAGIETLRLGF